MTEAARMRTARLGLRAVLTRTMSPADAEEVLSAIEVYIDAALEAHERRRDRRLAKH